MAVALIVATGVALLLKTAGLSGNTFSPSVPSLIVFGLLLIAYFGMKRVRKKSLSSVMLILLSAVLGLIVCLALELCGIAV